MADVYDEALSDVGTRKDQAVSDAGWTPIGERWERSDLDRCEHGRHSLDPCWGCPGGQSTGNLFLEGGQRIGTNLYGEPIIAIVDRRENRG